MAELNPETGELGKGGTGRGEEMREGWDRMRREEKRRE